MNHICIKPEWWTDPEFCCDSMYLAVMAFDTFRFFFRKMHAK